MKKSVFFLAPALCAALAAGALAAGEDAGDELLPEDEAPLEAPAGSVNLSQEFGLSSGRRSIDSFLGEFENPYAAPEYSYEGSRSEPDKQRAESLGKQ